MKNRKPAKRPRIAKESGSAAPPGMVKSGTGKSAAAKPGATTAGRRPPRRSPSKQGKARRKWDAFVVGIRRWRDRLRLVGRTIKATPPPIRNVLLIVVALLVFSLANLVYHVVHKPAEMLFPVNGVLKKRPAETWQQYAPLFREYSTAAISPELLAALAQVEASGDPVAHTYWRWRFAWNPFSIYQPASSAVGMYQMTDPAFADARHYCIRNHTVVAEGAWNDWDSCWFTGLYTRVLPSHAIELTAISLDRQVAAILAHSPQPANPQQKQELAAIIHLCGAGPARTFAHHGFQLIPGERCGDHEAAVYVGRVGEMRRLFKRLAGER